MYDKLLVRKLLLLLVVVVVVAVVVAAAVVVVVVVVEFRNKLARHISLYYYLFSLKWARIVQSV
jgi:hypothetical protein